MIRILRVKTWTAEAITSEVIEINFMVDSALVRLYVDREAIEQFIKYLDSVRG